MDRNIETIVLSDEDSDMETLNDSSVLIVEETESTDFPVANEVLDEDMTIIFSKKASVLPHARFDCTIPFTFSASYVSGPENENSEFCEQCFCYICDRLASVCKLWNVPNYCHCNAHKRSIYWKTLRDKRVMGYLHELKFTFTTEDMDVDLRRTEASLLEFSRTLVQKYTAFLQTVQNPDQSVCSCHPSTTPATRSKSAMCSKCSVKHQDYTPVMEHIRTFLDQSSKETPKTRAVRLLGCIRLFITHTVSGCSRSSASAVAVSQAVLTLFLRTVTELQMLMVDEQFPAAFTKVLQNFFQTLPFPPNCKRFKSCLSILSWDDPLISAVLKGQNTTGTLRSKGKKTGVLIESPVVVRARVLKLQEQEKFRELARYLRLVRSENIPEIMVMKDWVPLYLCKVGDYTGALSFFISLVCNSTCIICRLTPFHFVSYLRVFVYGRVPLGAPHPPIVQFSPCVQRRIEGHTDPFHGNHWEFTKGRLVLPKKLDVMKFALKVLNHNNDVFKHSESWMMLLQFANSSLMGSSLREPHYNFLVRTRDAAFEILHELHQSGPVHIPKSFPNEFPEQALLLLAIHALVWRLQHSLRPALNIIMTFKSNYWAARWLLLNLSPDVMYNLLCVIIEELTDEQTRELDMSEQSFISSFLNMFFMNDQLNLNLYSDPITRLLFHWDELKKPWQMLVRQQLQISENVLTEDKRMILKQMLLRSHR